MVTPEQLEGYAYQALNLLRRNEQQAKGGVDPVIAFVRGGQYEHMKSIGAEFGWAFADGQTRRLFFALLRVVVDAAQPDAVIFAAHGDQYLPTQKGLDVGNEELVRLTREDPARLKSDGYVTPVEVRTAWAQTAEHIATLTDPTGMGRIALQTKVPKAARGQLLNRCHIGSQQEFSGTSKMYGGYEWPSEGFALRAMNTLGDLLHDMTSGGEIKW